jgi:tetratricopeptide (TPR) repeat protein
VRAVVRRTRRTLAWVAAVGLLMVFETASVHAQNGGPVNAAYEQLYAGHQEQAQSRFEQLRARDPQGLAPWFGALFVHMARLEHDETLAPRFEQDIDRFLATAGTRHDRSKDDAEALFYLAQGYLLRSTYRINYEKGMWGAARDAAKSKGYSDEYVKRYPSHGDAYMALGLYNYYVDIAPNFVKVLRVLLLLPSGSRSDGLKQIERAARDGSMFAAFAEAALADIYGSFEGRLAEALPLAERFVRRYPDNAEMRLELASMYLHPSVEDYTRAAEQYTAVIAAAREPTPRQVSERLRGILGMANLRRSQWRLEEAIGLLNETIDRPPAQPPWALPAFLLRRANYRMLLNDGAAEADARRVLSTPAMSKFHKAAQQQIAALQQRRRTNEGVIYALLLEGNRLAAARAFDEARAAYERVGAMHPGDWQVRYRLAVLDFTREQYASAAAQLHSITTASARLPAWLEAGALLHLAWVRDLEGRREEAVKLYKQIADQYENEAPASAARLGIITPYRGRLAPARS